ncbi:GNAT family N-acetyltransferase [Galactobacter caseinivorans]|uniref:GNAT family N-acetyltransferase n=1 Tax=Galactobacter caseinivorans TaxID=2676123 RepID=UPI0018F6BF4B|nr:GNAT family N-acetyltransferase [Galactobacter caseinivorans]
MAATPLIAQQQLRVELDEDQERFNLFDQGVTAQGSFIGFLGFSRNGKVLDLQHTIIKEEFSGRGYARALVAIVLERTWGREERIIPTCSYVVDFLSRHPQYRHLVAVSGPTPPGPVSAAGTEGATGVPAAPGASEDQAATGVAAAPGAGPATASGTRPKGRHSA